MSKNRTVVNGGLGTTYTYTYKNENELREYIQAHHFEFSNSLLIQADVANWSFKEIDRLRRLLATLLPHAVMIGSNSAGCLAGGMKKQSMLYFTYFKEIQIKSSLFKLADNNSINDFVKGLIFDRPKAVMMIANELTGILKDCLGIFNDLHPQVAIAGGITGKSTIIFTEAMISEEGIAAVTFSGQNLTAEITWNEREARQNVSFEEREIEREMDGKIPAKLLKGDLGKKYEKKPAANRNFSTANSSHHPGKRLYDRNLREAGNPIADKLEIAFISHLPEWPDDRSPTVSNIFCRQKVAKLPGKSASVGNQTETILRISEQAGRKEGQCPNKRNQVGERLIQLLQREYQDDPNGLFISRRYGDSIIQNHPDIIFTTDLKGNFHMVNPAFTKAFGKKAEELKGLCWMEFLNPNKKERLKNGFEKAKTGQPVQLLMEIPGEMKLKTFHTHLFPIFVNDDCVEVLFFGRNITELRHMEEKLEKMAYYDEKTGLPNQKKLKQILNKRIKRAKRENRSFPILFIKIDRIKTINDAFGHHVGDKARIQLASRIQSVLPEGSFLGRFSTNKFTVLLGGKTDSDTVMAMCQRILQTIQEPLLFENQEFFIASSIGISVYPFDGQDYASLMKNADAALSRTDSGTNKTVVFYLNEMNKEMIERVELERSLRKAIENDEFFLAYQPIVNPATKEIVACEALLRWEHPKWGIVPPMKFIPVAEETGMIHTLGKWILKTACLQVKEWQRNGFEHISASVNVSAYQLQNNRFIDNIKQALDESGLAPQYLHLELTESVMIDRSLKTVDMLRELMEMGVHISIDDFGTGYSSLSYLKHFPIHTLKIDRSFIQNLNKQSPDFAIVHAILTMGHGLGLRIVAEGIETTEQLNMLTSLGCDFVQGYLIEKPMEARRFTHWLERIHNT